jgi:hypothetical protein
VFLLWDHLGEAVLILPRIEVDGRLHCPRLHLDLVPVMSPSPPHRLPLIRALSLQNIDDMAMQDLGSEISKSDELLV